MEQPDFKKLFNTIAGATPQKIDYKIRQDSNLFHDILFLDSFVHDSRFKSKQILLKSKKVIIPIERDCWELPYKKNKNGSELYITNSMLSISPAFDIKWTIGKLNNIVDDDELWINDVWLSREIIDNRREFVISGRFWALSIKISENFHIRLQDLQIPYLFSEMHSNMHNQ